MSQARMQCMQVWGGNQALETAVATTGLDVWLRSDPFGDDEAGGDVYYLSSCSSGRITRLILADVSGHGRRVAEVASTLRRVMQTHINRIDQSSLVDRINQDFVGLGDAATFATALIGTYFLPTRTLTVTNAGHPPPLFYSGRLRGWSVLTAKRHDRGRFDLPLGMFDGTRYGQFQVKLGEGDRALWVTDGVLEAEDAQGEMLGVEGVLSLLNELEAADSHTDPDAIIPRLVERVRALAPGNLEHDDVTALLLAPNRRTVSMRDNLVAPFRFLSQLIRPSVSVIQPG